VTVDADPSLNVRGTAAELYRLFANLLDNALRHAPDAGHVAVAAAGHDGCAEVSIADDGAGISADDLERVFDRFFSGRNETGNGAGSASISRAPSRGRTAATSGWRTAPAAGAWRPRPCRWRSADHHRGHGGARRPPAVAR
jgi:light-regulated signal transduction histidine kinase (bacteriophytochrome)